VSFEESYIRSFVAAVAAAAAVAFVVVAFAVRRRPRFGPVAMGLVGGVALAAAWALAHQIMRGAVPMSQWSIETIGRAVWPPDVTRRFPAIVIAACGAGALADRAPPVVRTLVVIGAMAAISMGVMEAARRIGTGSTVYWLGVVGIVAMGWMVTTALRDAAGKDSSALAALFVMVLVVGAAVVLNASGAYSLGLVFGAGLAPVGILAVVSRRVPRVVAGTMIPLTVAGALGVAIAGAALTGATPGLVGMAIVSASPILLWRRVPFGEPRGGVFRGRRARFAGAGALVGVGAAVAILGA
jgi:hypothetical protein